MAYLIRGTQGKLWTVSIDDTDGSPIYTEVTNTTRLPDWTVPDGGGISGEGSPLYATDAATILSQVSQDLRSQLPSDSPILLSYLDRVHKQILRTSRWRFLTSIPYRFDTVAGKSRYYIGPTGVSLPPDTVDTDLNLTDIYAVKRESFRDRTGFTDIAATADTPNLPGFTAPGNPLQWQVELTDPSLIAFYPTPDAVHTLEFRYYIQRKDITATTDVLQVPAEYRDVLIAGVNMYAYEFLKNPSEAQSWASAFNAGMREMIKDRNTYQTNTTDFIRPAA